MTMDQDHGVGEAVAARIERRWATLSIAIVGLLVGMAAFIGIHQATMPQGHVETADPKTLHLSGEFIESNLGSAAEPDGSVTVRAIGQQYSFTPQCVVVPADTPVTFRATNRPPTKADCDNQPQRRLKLDSGTQTKAPSSRSTPKGEKKFARRFAAGVKGIRGKAASGNAIKPPSFKFSPHENRSRCPGSRVGG